jgi:hypothetical protein
MTGSEKGHMSMTSGEQHGRHRHPTGSWTPEARPEHRSAHALVEPESLVEQTVPGLRKFDLGTIPASVTPPKTWRTAALFAVFASLSVVGGLVFAAATLVGKPKNTETIDALPNFPSLPIFVESTPKPGPPRPTGSRGPERSSLVAGPTRRPPASGKATLTALPTVPGTSLPEPPPPPPVRQTTPKRAFASNDPKEIGDRTEAFYRQVTDDPTAAYAMTTGELRTQGEETFRERYADISSVRVRQINIDPNQGTTVSEVQVTKKDGSTFVERRRLKFTSGTNPKISSEVTH